jgi:hypothetical protein
MANKSHYSPEISERENTEETLCWQFENNFFHREAIFNQIRRLIFSV